MKEEVASKAIESVAAKATYGGAGTAVIFGLNANEFAAVTGVVIAFLGLVVTGYYKHKTYQLEKKKVERDCDG